MRAHTGAHGQIIGVPRVPGREPRVVTGVAVDSVRRLRRPITSLELILDDELDASVREKWGLLQAVGVSSMGASAAVSNRPHVTLLARPALGWIDVSSLAPLLPIAVSLGAPVLFGVGERRVLALSVVPSGELLAFHRAVHHCAGGGEDAPHTAVGEWSPHVTLARRIKTADVAAALALIEGGELRGEAVGLRRWDSEGRQATTLLPSGDE